MEEKAHNKRNATSDSDSTEEENAENSSNTDEENEIEWVEESSESEPDLECDIWDDDCVTVEKLYRKNAIFGYHLIPTCLQEHEIQPTKKQKLNIRPCLYDELLKPDFIETFKNYWSNNIDAKINSIELKNEPFKYCMIDNFVGDLLVLDEIRKEFNEIELNKRSMDLYEFFQSEDLKKIEEKYIKEAYDFLKTDVKDWLEQLTGIQYHNISATCSVYSDTDFLLIHDDLEDDRSIAFILYLTDPIPGSKEELWTKEMGGLLELYNRDDKGHPTDPAQQIVPKNNRFVFFKVSNASYHQVTEVINMDHCRLSINGWFHTKKPDIYKTPPLDQPATGILGLENTAPLEIDFPIKNWINYQYLRKDTKKQIQYHIEKESEISLNHFLQEDRYQALYEVLKNNDIIWDTVGPPNRRKYEVISNKVMPSIVNDLITMFKSKSMFALLQEYTDLDLNSDLKPNIKPTLRYELQRWTPGSYSIFSEFEFIKENQLDLIMYIANPENLRVVGGQTLYVNTADTIEDALITLEPKANTLNIVFHDIARIVKYVSKRSFNEYFYMFICSYKE